jgi:hypothetical protein
MPAMRQCSTLPQESRVGFALHPRGRRAMGAVEQGLAESATIQDRATFNDERRPPWIARTT